MNTDLFIQSLIPSPLPALLSHTYFLCPRIVSISRSVCNSLLFSLLRHSQERKISTDLLLGTIGEFKANYMSHLFFFPLDRHFVINAARLENEPAR